MMKAIMLGITLLFAQGSYAENSVIYGFGWTNCGTYLKDLKEGERMDDNINASIYLSYAHGWLTALNRHLNAIKPIEGRDILGGTKNNDAMQQWLMNHCTENPFEPYGVAVERFVTHLLQKDE